LASRLITDYVVTSSNVVRMAARSTTTGNAGLPTSSPWTAASGAAATAWKDATARPSIDSRSSFFTLTSFHDGADAGQPILPTATQVGNVTRQAYEQGDVAQKGPGRTPGPK